MADKKKKAEGPFYMYGPKGESRIFNHKSEVPKGWKDSPSASGKPAEGEE